MKTLIRLPLYEFRVAAGFPSPAEDYVEKMLDLNEYVIAHPAATFFVRAAGASMEGAGIRSGDLLIVDRAAEVHSGDVAICLLEGEYTVKRIRRYADRIALEPENGAYPTITVTPETDFELWGKVTYVIHEL